VQPAAIKELDSIMEKYFSDSKNVKSSMVGGEKTAASILNSLDTAIENKLMEQVRTENEDLAMRIEDQMFVFENLREVDDRGIQTMMREVSTDLLALALKGVDDEMQNKFLKNMSSRAAEMLREDMEAKGPVKLSEVETAQKEILAVARKLEESGEIVLTGGGEEMV
jgi:flagellar motor switch protein FliG